MKKYPSLETISLRREKGWKKCGIGKTVRKEKDNDLVARSHFLLVFLDYIHSHAFIQNIC
jgi:hypothetical protein